MSFANQALSRSLFLFHLGGSACNNCDIEILDALTPKFDVERFGITLVGSIRHADVILLSGIFNKKAAIRVRRLYEQAPQPVIVIAIGGCACTGLIFRGSYNWDEPVGNYIPIDAYVAGCPPKPEAIIAAIAQVIEKLRAPAAEAPSSMTDSSADAVARQLRSALGDRMVELNVRSERRVWFVFDAAAVEDMARVLFDTVRARFQTASGVDGPVEMEILYHWAVDGQGLVVTGRTRIPRERPEIPSITPICPAAEWVEREMWELLGIQFPGHPDLRHLLLQDDWPEGRYPLRRDYRKE